MLSKMMLLSVLESPPGRVLMFRIRPHQQEDNDEANLHDKREWAEKYHATPIAILRLPVERMQP